MYVTNWVGLEQFQSLIIKIWQYEAYIGGRQGTADVHQGTVG